MSAAAAKKTHTRRSANHFLSRSVRVESPASFKLTYAVDYCHIKVCARGGENHCSKSAKTIRNSKIVDNGNKL